MDILRLKPLVWCGLGGVGLFLLFFYAYSGVVNVPFYLDDYSSIIYSPLVKQPVDLFEIWQTSTLRFIPYLGFALQTGWFEQQSAGFHIFGLGLHLGVVSLLAYLCYLLLKIASLSTLDPKDKSKLFVGYALLAGAIYLLHPQNTQAAIYVVQQATLWVVFFYVLTLVSYTKIRSESRNQLKIVWCVLLGISVLGALLSKQNSATLPLAILLIEWLFFGKWVKRLLIVYLACALAILCYFFYTANFDIAHALSMIDLMSRETTLISRENYFTSQVLILWHYIWQFFNPTGLHLEYDYVLAQRWDLLHFISLSAHIVCIALAISYRRKFSLLCFGILFYYVSHLIESSFLPIRDLAFEHRTYLPNVGLVIALVASIHSVSHTSWYKHRRWTHITMTSVLVFFLVVMAFLSRSRVQQWADPNVFYKNEITLSPNSARATSAYARTLIEQNNCPLAIGYYAHVISLYENQHESALGIQPETLQNYVICLRQLGIHQKAEYYEMYLLDVVKEPIRRSAILTQRGVYFIEAENYKDAESPLEEAVKLDPKNLNAVMTLVITKLHLGETYHAKRLLEHALLLQPGNQMAISLLEQINALKNKSK